MAVTVHYHAQLRRAAGRAEEQLDAEAGLTIAGLLRRLAERHGEPLRGLLAGDAGGGLPRTLLVFVGDEPASAADPVHDGDQVTLLTPMAGGAPTPRRPGRTDDETDSA